MQRRCIWQMSVGNMKNITEVCVNGKDVGR